MILLRNFDFAIKYFNYEEKKELEISNVDKINGWYKITDGILMALLVLEDELYFLYGSDKYLIEDSFRVILEKLDSSKKIVFNLMENQTEVLIYKYQPSDEKLNVTPFEYIDDEDFEWEQFVKTIINNADRKKLFIENLVGNITD